MPLLSQRREYIKYSSNKGVYPNLSASRGTIFYRTSDLPSRKAAAQQHSWVSVFVGLICLAALQPAEMQ